MNARYTEVRGGATKSGADMVASAVMGRRTFPPLAILAGISLVAVACATAVDGTPTKRIPREEPIDLEPPDPPTLEAGVVDDDSGVFAPSRPREAGAPTDAAVVDAGVVPNCPNYLTGSLRVDELMIASRDGSGDKGEWVELRNYALCTLSLDGLVVRSPRGTGVDQASLTGISLAPGESVVIANTLVPVDNHFLPGRVRPFVATTAPASDAGAIATADALKNDGDTIDVVRLGAPDVLLEHFTYPKFANLPRAVSLAFPNDCEESARVDFARWSTSARSWTLGFTGTPNAPNDDVTCR
jgi:hypothetical protein